MPANKYISFKSFSDFFLINFFDFVNENFFSFLGDIFGFEFFISISKFIFLHSNSSSPSIISQKSFEFSIIFF